LRLRIEKHARHANGFAQWKFAACGRKSDRNANDLQENGLSAEDKIRALHLSAPAGTLPAHFP
jgi:hypothetical protein